MTRRSILTVVAAVLGLALSAGLAWSASQLAGQRIGLASEPLAVTQGLAPHRRAVASPKPVRTDHEKVSVKPAPRPASSSSPQIFSPSTTAPAPVTPVAPPPPATTSAAATSAPAPATTPAAPSSAAGGSQPSSGASRHHDDHHPDD